MEQILEMKSIVKSFSGVTVLDNVDLSLDKAHILGIVGENGAGKSTLMNIITGVMPCDSGIITYEGKPYSPVNAQQTGKDGIVIIHQELSLFGNLSVIENMFIDDLPKKRFSRLVDWKLMSEKALESLRYLQADIPLNTKVGDLEMGKRQQVEIAKALVKNASVLIFDEPTTSLSSSEKENLFRVIRELRNAN